MHLDIQKSPTQNTQAEHSAETGIHFDLSSFVISLEALSERLEKIARWLQTIHQREC